MIKQSQEVSLRITLEKTSHVCKIDLCVKEGTTLPFMLCNILKYHNLILYKTTRKSSICKFKV